MPSVLDDPLTHGWFTPLISTTEYSQDSPVCLWQRIEGDNRGIIPYVFRFISTWENDPNNLLAASWPFHQMFHGMHLDFPEEVPGLVIEFVDSDGTTVEASDGTRYKVNIIIRFFDDVHNATLKRNVLGQLKDGSKVNHDGSIESFVHVLDVASFRECVDVKKALTEGTWRRYREGKL